jgi:hypothetical protein
MQKYHYFCSIKRVRVAIHKTTSYTLQTKNQSINHIQSYHSLSLSQELEVR